MNAYTSKGRSSKKKNPKKFTYEKYRDYVKVKSDCVKLDDIKVFPTCNHKKEKRNKRMVIIQSDW